MSALESIAQLLLKQLGSEGSGATVASLIPALKNLLPTENGELDLGSLIGKLSSNGSLMSVASSWLGDGENSPISGAQLASILGQDKLGQFAEQIGIDSSTASAALSNVLPQFIDENSKGGSLMDNPAVSMVQGALKGLF
jgi:uncharacterized protein YidB (DUF937 family)